MKEEKKLTPKQQLFISEYLIDFNATRAAKAAGYSEDTAYSTGHENLRKPEIRVFIEKKINETLDINKMTLKKEIIDELRKIAFPVDLEESNENGRLKALELLGKYMFMFGEKQQLSTIDKDGKEKGLEIVVKRASDN